MQKPTSTILADILNFVLNDSRVMKSLAKRDNDEFTTAMETRCRYFKRHPSDPAKAAYVIDFLYATKYQQDEEKDDVSILVEVTEGTPPSFEIRDVRFY